MRDARLLNTPLAKGSVLLVQQAVQHRSLQEEVILRWMGNGGSEECVERTFGIHLVSFVRARHLAITAITARRYLLVWRKGENKTAHDETYRRVDLKMQVRILANSILQRALRRDGSSVFFGKWNI